MKGRPKLTWVNEIQSMMVRKEQIEEDWEDSDNWRIFFELDIDAGK